MSGYSLTWLGAEILTVGELRRQLEDIPDHLRVRVPSLNRCPGEFIEADHLFVCIRDGEVCLDGDISEAKK